ncbi:hypothetical protein DASC09_030560 [Saccharomycopsis crataegensis]|uniref:GRAM domain-containing protein n=1 Tax=Saccharomycopsis crataegensis TaxID=43959 RepID=A0AAV5QMD2_9ASCO|nr:hypothetical protein DASC09_030560 [Saccharomycopsis crataegensis]
MSLDCLTYSTTSAGLPFLLLPKEHLKHSSPKRVSLTLNPTHLPSEYRRGSNGTAFITNKRLVYIAEKHPDNDFQDFVLLFNANLHDFKMETPWFGANKFTVLFKPTMENAGLNHMYIWKGIFSFNEGGIADFSTQVGKAYNEWKYGQDGEQLPAYHE